MMTLPLPVLLGKATLDRLHEMENTVPEKIMQLASDIGEELKYKEE